MRLGLWSLLVFSVQLILMALDRVIIWTSASTVWNLILFFLMWIVALRGYYFALIRSRRGTPLTERPEIILSILAAVVGVVLLFCSAVIVEFCGLSPIY
jgi:hypothetical protein